MYTSFIPTPEMGISKNLGLCLRLVLRTFILEVRGGGKLVKERDDIAVGNIVLDYGIKARTGS